MIKIKKIENPVHAILTTIVCICMIIYIYYSITSVFYPFQVEYREGATVDITNVIINGENPYTLDKIPPHLYVYGGFFSFLASLVSKLLPHSVSLLAIHRILSLLFLLMASIVGYVSVFRETKNKLYSFIAFTLLLSCTDIAARPEALAVFLFVLILFLSKKAESFIRIFILSLLTVLCFYVKQYFVIIYLPLCLMLLFKKKKWFITYAFSVPIFFFLSFLLVRSLFPLYFASNLIHHTAVASYNILHLAKQGVYFIIRFFPLLLIFLPAVLNKLCGKKLKIRAVISKKPDESFLTTESDLLRDVYFYAILIVIFALLFIIGGHTGTWMTYYYQLLLPPLTIFCLTHIDGINIKNYTAKKNQRLLRLSSLLLSYSLVFSLCLHYKATRELVASEANNNWQSALDLIEEHSPENAYLPAYFTAVAIENNYPVSDNGQTEYSSTLYSDKALYKYLIPASEQIPDSVIQWQDTIDQKIINKHYSIICIAKNEHPLINSDLLTAYYQRIETLVLITGNQAWETEFWVPN